MGYSFYSGVKTFPNGTRPVDSHATSAQVFLARLRNHKEGSHLALSPSRIGYRAAFKSWRTTSGAALPRVARITCPSAIGRRTLAGKTWRPDHALSAKTCATTVANSVVIENLRQSSGFDDGVGPSARRKLAPNTAWALSGLSVPRPRGR